MNPKVFISYSHDSQDYKDWIRSFADRLTTQGVVVTLDQYDLALGDMAPRFMEKGISENDYVLLFISRPYIEKAKRREGGVGFEIDLASGEIIVSQNHRKFIPVLVQVDYPDVMPLLKGVKSIRITNLFSYEKEYEEIYATITGQTLQKPELGPIRKLVQSPPDTDPFDVLTLGQHKSLTDYCYWDVQFMLPALSDNSIAELYTSLQRHTQFETVGMHVRAEPIILSPFYIKKNHPEIVYESGDLCANTTNVINYERFVISHARCSYSFIEYRTHNPFYHSPEVAEDSLMYLLPILAKLHTDLGQQFEIDCMVKIKSSADATFLASERPLPTTLRLGEHYVHKEGVTFSEFRMSSVELDSVERFFNRILEGFTSTRVDSAKPFLQVDHSRFPSAYGVYYEKVR